MNKYETIINTLNQLRRYIYEEQLDYIQRNEDEDNRYTVAINNAVLALNALKQICWERDVAIEQLSELGLNFGEKVDDVKEAINKSNILNAVYKNGIFVCLNCGASIFPLSLYEGDHCIKCGQYGEEL